MPLRGGQLFAGYRIIRLLGSGGMGEVYLAEHPRLPRHDAVKVLPVEVSVDHDYRERFAREADLAARLWHPNIVSVHDRGDYDGQLWISMDYVDGVDAGRWMAQRYSSGAPIDQVQAIVTAVASALDYAHQQGLLHRDVKPANIMITHTEDADQRRILLTDFGIARNIDDISGLTATNFTVGTVAYASPEQLMGQTLDGRADQYALAAAAYHLLTGSPVFPHSNHAVVISHHLNVAPPKLADTDPDLAALDPIFAKALAKDAHERFARCADFARAFAGAGQMPQPDSPDAHTQPAAAAQHGQRTSGLDDAAANTIAWRGLSRRRWLPIAAVLGVALIAGSAAALWPPAFLSGHHERDGSQPTPHSLTAAAPPPAPTVNAVPAPPSTTASPVDTNRYSLPGCWWSSDQPGERPTSLTFQACADGGQKLDSMTWSSWGVSGAQGTGFISWRVCEPDCADGHNEQYAVDVSAFDPRPPAYTSRCPANLMIYSQMVVSFLASPPTTGITADTTYLGRPAIRFSTSPDTPSQERLADPMCS
ncbi:MAG: serine/threonine protein kinase, bacterial [Mycobacterium sp.]|nr:serine/threonine protein kinase, bacterial [Mycobacterium sp.]